MSPKTNSHSNVPVDLGLPVPRGMFRTPNPSPAPSPENSQNATPVAHYSPIQADCSPVQQLTPVNDTANDASPFNNMPSIKVCDADEEADFYKVLQTKMSEILENNMEDAEQSSSTISDSTMLSGSDFNTSSKMNDSNDDDIDDENVEPIDVKQQIEIWEDRLTSIAKRCALEKLQMEKLELERIQNEKLRLEKMEMEQNENPVISISTMEDEVIAPAYTQSLHSQKPLSELNHNFQSNHNDNINNENNYNTYKSQMSSETLEGISSLEDDIQNFNDIVNNFENQIVPGSKKSSQVSSPLYDNYANKIESDKNHRPLSLCSDKDSPMKTASNKLVIYFKNSSRPDSPNKSLSPSSSIGSEKTSFTHHHVNVT